MAPNPRRLDARLQSEVYDKIPAIDCQGLCHDSCGPIGLTVRERQRIERAAGKPLTCGAGASCSMLTPDRRCGVYDLRPLICRLWGVVETLPCPYGCRPERYLSAKEGMELTLLADKIGGSDLASHQLAAAALRLQSASEATIRDLVRGFTPRPTIDGREPALPPTVLHRRKP